MNRFVAMMSAGAVAILLSGGAMAAEPVVTPAQIAAAKTAADHEAIERKGHTPSFVQLSGPS